MRHTVLIVDDEKLLRFTFEEFLSQAGYEVTTAADYDEAVTRLTERGYDVIFTDIILGGRSGIDLLREARRMGISSPVIVITGYPDIDTASEAVRLGAFDYISKPVDRAILLKAAEQAARFKDAVDKREHYRKNLDAIFRSIKEGIISLDSRFRVIEANNSAMEICGLADRFNGKKFNILPRFCGINCLSVLEKAVSGEVTEPARIECRRSDRPGQVVTISTSPVMGESGEPNGTIVVLSDDTRLEELEKETGERRELRKIVGSSREMKGIRSMIEMLADIDSTVLISGESGTGKELIAEALYQIGERKKMGPFVVVNCAAIPENLIESELFGHERGSFTGAISRQLGKFEIAGKGMIFLDEIGDMSMQLQSKLLRVLQNGEFHRVGGKERLRTGARVIAASNKDLNTLVKQGNFREDLYYRLKVMEINIPSLKKRKNDIPELVDHFIGMFNAKFHKGIQGVAGDVMRIFMEHNWPGNVRELEHAVEHACILCRNQTITVEHLPRELKEPAFGPAIADKDDESSRLLEVLEKTRWNKGKAARLLGIDRSTLYRRMKKYGV